MDKDSDTQGFSEILSNINQSQIVLWQAKVEENTSTELDQLLLQLHSEVSGQIVRSEQLVVCQTQLADANRRLSSMVGNFKI